MLITASQAITPDGLRNHITLDIRNGIITHIVNDKVENPDKEIDGILIPGFVDIHCHGGGGFYFSDANIDDISEAVSLHRSHGTSTLIASLVTASPHVLKNQIENLLPLIEKSEIAGIHLEGPYLSPVKAGAHEIGLLKAPDIAEIKGFFEVSRGTVAMITIAPELPGALEAIEFIASSGVIPAIGHTDAPSSVMRDAINAGAQVVTHFHNAMQKFDQSRQTPSDYLLSTKIPLEIILDKVHLDISTIKKTLTGNHERIIFVTDAMSAAGCNDGNYHIGNLDVEVLDGVARLSTTGALAGSTLTMDQAFLNAIETGVKISDAVLATSTNAANLLGLSEIGRISEGSYADLLVYHPESNSIEKVEVLV